MACLLFGFVWRIPPPADGPEGAPISNVTLRGGKQTGTILIRGARQLLTLHGRKNPRRGGELNDLAIINDGAVLVSNGQIDQVGPTRRVENLKEARGAVEIDVFGRVVMPGFVDSHTHLLCPPVGVAENDLENAARLVGTSSARLLASRARPYLEAMVRHGTTTVEVKTGCGLDESGETKLLRVIDGFKNVPLDVVPTFLFRAPAGAPGSGEAAQACELLSKIARRRLARFADLALDSDRARQPLFERFLQTAAETGVPSRLHCGPNTAGLAGALAGRYPVVGLDHAETVPSGFDGLVTLLPPGMQKGGRPASGRALVDTGMAIALASNFHPSFSPVLSMQAVVALAVKEFGLTPSEALVAATINGAHAAGCAERVGSLDIGKSADLLILNASDYRDLASHLGTNLVHIAMKRGALVYKESAVLPLAVR